MTFLLVIMALLIGALADELRNSRKQKRLNSIIELQQRVIDKYEPIRQREALEGTDIPESVYIPTGGEKPAEFNYDRLREVLQSNGYEVLSDDDLFRAIGYTPDLFPDKTPAPVPEETPAPVPDETPAPVPDETPAPVPEDSPGPDEKPGPKVTPKTATKRVTKRKKPTQVKKTEDSTK